MIKKRFFILTVLMCSWLSIFAQVPVREQLAVGARLGATMSFVSFTPTVDTNLKFGLQGGAACRYIGEKFFGVQAEINYSQRGWADKSADYNYSRTLHYLEIPFMSHIWFGKKSFRWFFNLGPEIAFLVGENAKTNLEEAAKMAHHEKIPKYFDYGICIGTGFEFNTRAGIYQLEARYNFGLGDMFPNTAADTFRKSSNQNISLCLGILFNVLK